MQAGVGVDQMENGICVRLQAKCCMIPLQTIDGVSYTFQSSGAWLEKYMIPRLLSEWYHAAFRL